MQEKQRGKEYLKVVKRHLEKGKRQAKTKPGGIYYEMANFITKKMQG